MTRDRLWLALAILLPALAATIAPMSTIDLAYQVRAGELMLASGAVLRTDPFTFTAFGDPWLNQQWGAGVVFALVHGAGGWGGLVVLRAVLVAAAVGLVVTGARRRLAPRPAVLLALAGFLVGIASLGLRAQLFGIVLFAAVTAILAWRDRRPALTWAIPLLVLAWANLHGSFFLGPAAVAVALADELFVRRAGERPGGDRRLRAMRAGVTRAGDDRPGSPRPGGSRPDVGRLAAVLVLSLAASCVTPFGPAVWPYAVGIASNAEITRLITEWQRTSPFTVTGALFYASVIGAAALVTVARRRGGRPSWPTLAWLVGLAALGAWAERGVAWWAFGAPVALAPAVAVLLAAPRVARADPPALRRLNAILVGALAIAVVVFQPVWRGGDPLAGPEGILRDAPAGLARALGGVAGPSDRAVVPQPWASWFEWSVPGVPVMVDSRVEVVPASAWEDYLLIMNGGPTALATLERVAATAVIVDPGAQPELARTLAETGSGWTATFEDADGLLFVREPGDAG